MFAHLLCAPDNEPKRPRNTIRLSLERLETRECPAVIIFNVNTTDDTPLVNSFEDPDTKAIVLEDKNKNVSLRSVVEYAKNNVLTGAYAQNHYEVRLNGVSGKTISLSGGELGKLTSNFNFVGSGVTVERPLASEGQIRLFEVGAETVTRFFEMTLRNGNVITAGGAILNMGEAKIEACTLTDNTAFQGGGAIFSGNNSKLTITNTVLGLNNTNGSGGAIAVDGALLVSITGCSILGNKTTANLAGQGYGGGIYLANTASATLDSTNIIGNEAKQDGGGIYVSNTPLIMNGGQLTGNIAAAFGGGIYVDAVDKVVTLSKVSVTQNSAGQKGGGAYVLNGTLDGSITVLSKNTATGGIPGIGYNKANKATAPITIDGGEQIKEED